MIGTYAAVAAVCVASLAIGQAALSLCGVRAWSWPAPAVGLALLCAACWGTARLPGDGTVGAIVVPVATVLSLVHLWRRLPRGGGTVRAGVPVALGALLATAIPFAAEGHFGILGTSFNPDMSQHLLAADRLAHGISSPLLRQGYPLGPHAIVASLHKGLGIGLVQGFDGLTISVAILASLTALAAFAELPALPRTASALLVGLAYVVASYFAQGAFKETMQALFLLAFVLALREAECRWRGMRLRFVPAALIAVGSVYTYSFPGLIWLGGTTVLWLLAHVVGDRGGGARPHRRAGLDPQRPAGPAAGELGLAVLAFAVITLPELGRMIDFRNYETFNPHGPGLGNLFGQISPFEALGIWPSGDFRLAPGDGAVPAAAYYLGIAFALVLFGYGILWCRRRRETALLSGLGAAALAYAAARLGGTPYTAAKAIEIAAPLVALAILLPLPAKLAGAGWVSRRTARAPGTSSAHGLAVSVFAAAAALCSLLALANAPVGPTTYSPALTSFRGEVGAGPTLVLAPPELLGKEHGTPYLAWELRGGRVCIAAEGQLVKPPPGVRFAITEGRSTDGGAPTGGPQPLRGFRVRRARPPYLLWEATGKVAPHSPCPLIAVRQARQGPGG